MLKLKNFIKLNPKEHISKGEIVRQVAMADLEPFNRDIKKWSYVKYKSGTKFRNGDILLARITPCLENGKTSFVNLLKQGEVAVGSTEFYVLRAIEGKMDPNYLYYLSISQNFRKNLIKSMTGTSGRQRVTKEALLNYETDIPDIDNQKDIGLKLSLIDDIIRINNKINDNLMELKTTIFNKMFSINLTNCLNGKIKDIAEVRTGKRPKIKYSKKGSTPIYPIIGASKIMGYTDEYLYNKSIITTGRVGTLGIVKRYREPVWVSDNSFIFITKYEDYLYELLTHFINYSALNIGSTQPLITQTEFKNVDIYIPKREELIEFKEKVVTLTEQQFELRQQNRLLNDLKSYLLSKLF